MGHGPVSSESFASLHRKAVREANRVELQKAINLIRQATHAAVDRWKPDHCWCYGDLKTCEEFCNGLERDVVVVSMTPEIMESLISYKIKVYR
jgi:hypothetical protein